MRSSQPRSRGERSCWRFLWDFPCRILGSGNLVELSIRRSLRHFEFFIRFILFRLRRPNRLGEGTFPLQPAWRVVASARPELWKEPRQDVPNSLNSSSYPQTDHTRIYRTYRRCNTLTRRRGEVSAKDIDFLRVNVGSVSFRNVKPKRYRGNAAQTASGTILMNDGEMESPAKLLTFNRPRGRAKKSSECLLNPFLDSPMTKSR